MDHEETKRNSIPIWHIGPSSLEYLISTNIRRGKQSNTTNSAARPIPTSRMTFSVPIG